MLKASLGSKEDFGLFPYWLLATTVLFKGGDVRLYTSLPPTGSLQLSLTCATGGELEKKKQLSNILPRIFRKEPLLNAFVGRFSFPMWIM